MELEKRLRQYASATGVRIVQDPNLWDWRSLGLPDLRGFTPHLRRVREGRWKGGLWTLHDLLHVLFYDYAALVLGRKAFEDHQRFLEVHLASELFAVYVLDYCTLIPKGKGLAVELDLRHWNRYESLNHELPDIDTEEFCSKLGRLYFEGRSDWLQSEALADQLKKDKGYQEWVGHEIRYTEKQRLYAQMWWFDLQMKAFNKKIPVIQGSAAAEAVWDLKDQLLSAGERQWKDLVSQIQKSLKEHKGNPYWERLPKYRKSPKKGWDFRFTSIQALTPSQFRVAAKESAKPSPSGLYFLWQLLSKHNPKKLNKTFLRHIKELANEAQNNSKVRNSLYQKLHEEALKLPPVKGRPELELISCFFLP